MKEEIIGGLKNAIERGEPMEKAVQSFVKAGYNPQEVRAAANALSQGATSIIHAEEKPAEKPFPTPSSPLSPEGKPAEKKKSRRTLIIILIVILVLIIGAIGVFIFFPELLEGIL
jgi:hypothetical protein